MAPTTGPFSLPARSPEWAGELELDVDLRGERSVAVAQFHRGALRVLRPHYLDASGQVEYTIINPGGAYLGADAYRLDIGVRPQAALLLTTQSATKVYRTPQGAARQEMAIRLGAGSVLEHVPDQLIVYRQGSYRQSTHVQMDPSATLVQAEVITPGWSPAGAAFAFDELRLRTEIRVTGQGGGRRLAVDSLRIVPGPPDDDGAVEIAGLGFMEGSSHSGQLLVADRRVDAALVARLRGIAAEHAVRCGVTLAGVESADGLRALSVRTLADTTGAITALHHEIIDLLRAQWRDQPALDLRKH